MTESKRKNGSVILSSGEKGRTKSSKNNKEKRMVLCILTVGTVAIVAAIIGAMAIATYARNNNCESIFWNHLGEFILYSVLAIIIDVFIAFAINHFTQGNKRIVCLVIFVVFLVIILLFFDCGVYAKVKAQVLEKQESSVHNSDDNTDEEEKEDTSIPTILYNVDIDPFMDKNTLELYYGQSVEGKRESEVRAQILYNNLNNNKPTGNSSTTYNDLCEIADAEYKTYLHEQKRDKESIHEELFENRIGRLQQSLNNREKADKENETLANEGPLATGYKDMGDEYFRRGRQHDAIEVYEESAKWYMRAICHAAAESDMKGVKDCLKKYEELGEEVEKLADVSSDRKEKINNMIQSYKEFITLLGKGK